MHFITSNLHQADRAKGMSSRCDPSMLEFIRNQEPGAKYILTVCSGSAILAQTGILDGKKATTHKMSFNKIKARLFFQVCADQTVCD
jgi:transcriptional regulator GlxA family with amidase domain